MERAPVVPDAATWLITSGMVTSTPAAWPRQRGRDRDVYAHVDKLVDRGVLTADELGLATPTASTPVVAMAPRAR